jgi:aminoglycoside phosphotransferase (APT) family kinase protein
MTDSTRATPADGTIAVREADTIDAEALRDWLMHQAAALVPAGSLLTIRQYPAGFSNLTYRVTVYQEHGEQEYVLRRPPHGVKPGVAHDMVREHGLLMALHPLGLPVPKPIACCADPAVLGAPFYLMAHVPGTILRGAPPADLLADPQINTTLGALSQTVVETLARLHAVPVTGTPLAALGKPDGYVQRQVDGWTRRWQAARTHDVPSIDALAAWLAAHQPLTTDFAASTTLVHNDFKLDNLVLDPSLTTVRAILDWEMATIGDPLMDVGTTLAYWVEPTDAPIFRSLGLGITALPGAYSRTQFANAYAAATGRDLTQLPFYLAFGLFKVAVIAQQIYARYAAGLTSDARFAQLREVVDELGAKGRAVIAE